MHLCRSGGGNFFYHTHDEEKVGYRCCTHALLFVPRDRTYTMHIAISVRVAIRLCADGQTATRTLSREITRDNGTNMMKASLFVSRGSAFLCEAVAFALWPFVTIRISVPIPTTRHGQFRLCIENLFDNETSRPTSCSTRNCCIVNEAATQVPSAFGRNACPPKSTASAGNAKAHCGQGGQVDERAALRQRWTHEFLCHCHMLSEWRSCAHRSTSADSGQRILSVRR